MAVQWRQYRNTAQEAAEGFRKACTDLSWGQLTYQIVNPQGRAFWWNCGSITEEWLLRNDPDDAYLVVWDTVVPYLGEVDDAVQDAAAQLAAESASGDLEVVVLSRHGRSRIKLPAAARSEGD